MTGNLFPARLRTTHIEKHQNMTYRRNGKLQACEPCRKGKLRCDHMMPHCGRCLKRGKTDKCIYHPAPLTKSATKRSPQSDQTLSSTEGKRTSYQPLSGTGRTSVPAAYLAHLERTDRPTTFLPFSSLVQSEGSLTASTATSVMQSPSHQSESRLAYIAAQQVIKESRQPSVNHLVRTDAQGFENGSSFISHSAVLAENEPNIGLSPPESTGFRVLQAHIDRGVTVLLLLKDLSSIQKYINKWFSFAGGVVVIEPMVKIYLDGIWTTWHNVLESSKAADVQAMSAQIWENTSKPLSRLLKRETTAREFCANVTGADLRWEVIGILVSLVSLVAQSLKDGDPVFCSHDSAPVDRAALAVSMHNASKMCVDFCDDLGVLNDLYLWLLYENSIAYCSLRSRGGYDNWKKTSAFAAALQCANLHQEIKVDDDTPFFIAELRKRLFICAYSNDKSSAVLAGRPPKLTRLYCRLQIPLDLTDDQTMSEGPELQAAIAELDEEGWNQEGAVQRSTFARISVTNALATEEILEISLGYLPYEEIVRRAADIEARALKSWDDLPEFLRIDISDPWSSQRSPLELLFLIFIRLASLDHHFLLQRTLSKKVHSGSTTPNASLLSVCSEIFRVVVMMVDNKDYFRDFQIDFVQILCMHGIPAAAVLAVELLHQERNPTPASVETFPLHRSDSIQSLSVFVSCLGTIRPDANGYQSCHRGKTFLKKILDLILGPGPAAPRSDQTEIDGSADPTLGTSLFEPGNDSDFMRWLDDVHWEQETWINFA
ncbi:hypothetical protein BU25DRAFT_445890 [Macroventuria anomochaeta]|uniref:Uncharacterized protein n=1 Tax=Macroventuria anomochaeta TaxID=301207 RepID=A0ACB6SC05_9PLEO|nr:uncharacterized protein BU25DRAFT_445890 [Macroventuria anomochaeta]KAF2631836.1 hypothetical protein BU25DRAFT_445890 [Macroventuria anomochaeta]